MMLLKSKTGSFFSSKERWTENLSYSWILARLALQRQCKVCDAEARSQSGPKNKFMCMKTRPTCISAFHCGIMLRNALTLELLNTLILICQIPSGKWHTLLPQMLVWICFAFAWHCLPSKNNNKHQFNTGLNASAGLCRTVFMMRDKEMLIKLKLWE